MLTKSADSSALLSGHESPANHGHAAVSSRPEPPEHSEVPDHPALARFWPSEQRAILWFRIEKSTSQEGEVNIDDLVAAWESGPASTWRRVKIQIDGRMQVREIERHKYHLSQHYGYDVGWDFAATDWIEKFAALWREWWESQRDSIPDLDAEPI